MENKDGQFKIKVFNVMYKCGVCEKFHNIKEHVPYVITQIVGFQPVKTGYSPAAMSLIVCPTCFKDNKLEEEESKIFVPGGIQNKLALQ